MQQRDAELKQRAGVFALQIGVVLACVVFVESPRLRVGLPRTLPFAVGGDGGGVHVAWIASALAAGGLVAVVLRFLPAWRRLTGAFGGAAAAALAVVLVAGGRALIGHVAPAWLLGEHAAWLAWTVAVPAIVLALLAGPVLCERNAFSLLWVAAVLGAPLVLARHQASAETVLAGPIGVLEEAAPERGPLFLALPDSTPREYAWALSRSATTPERSVLVVPSGSPEELWMRRAGWTGLSWQDGRFEAVPAVPRDGRIGNGPIRVSVSWNGREPVVRAAPVTGSMTTSVVTPAGVLRFSLDERGHGTAAAGGQEPLQDMVGPMPTGTLLRVLVVSGAAPDAYGWQDVMLP